jgi:hypothetical protein
MKLLPIIFGVIAVASSNSIPAKKSFNDVFDLTIGEFAANDVQSEFGHLKTANHECMRKKLKLAVIGDKLVEQNIGVAAIKAAANDCLENPEPMFNKNFDVILKKLAESNEYKGKVDCIKQQLFELQPDSDLLVNFDVQHMKNTKDECKIVANIETFLMESAKFTDEKHAEMGIEQCMAMDVMEIKIIGLSIFVMAYSPFDMVPEKIEFRKKMVEKTMKRNQQMLKCTLEKIEKVLIRN